MRESQKYKKIDYCPFCGSLDILHHETFMECNLCYATGPKILNKEIDYNMIWNAAVIAWNNRYKPIRNEK